MTPRRAYTLIEMTMVVVVAAILAVFAFSDSEASAEEEGKNAGLVFEADVQFARGKTIARPDEPLIIKIDPANNKYWVASAATPDTPITHPQKKTPYVMSFGPGGSPGYKRVTITAYDFGGDQIIAFDSMGSTDQQADAVLQLASGGAEYEVLLAPASAKCTVMNGKTKNLAPVQTVQEPNAGQQLLQ